LSPLATPYRLFLFTVLLFTYIFGMLRYLVIIDCSIFASGKFYGAFAPDMPVCTATGRNMEDTLSAVRRCLEEHLALLSEAGTPPPPPRSFAEHECDYAEAGEHLLAADSVIAMIEVAPLGATPRSPPRAKRHKAA
jgi:predicted RNase H-like HicB family nuclease